MRRFRLVAALLLCFLQETAFAAFLTTQYIYSSLSARKCDFLSKIFSSKNVEGDDDEPEDTVRVRIWRALAAQKGRDMSLTQLSSILGERRSDVRHHLCHVEKQCKTLQSKSEAWRLRRGLPMGETKRLSITKRRGSGKRNELYIKLQ